jgi:hypothetical protein
MENKEVGFLSFEWEAESVEIEEVGLDWIFLVGGG